MAILASDAAAWRRRAAAVLEIESAAVLAMRDSLDDSFARAVQTIASARGKVACCGVGKSGHIARKIAATLSSTGTPAFFLHASEAGHGDLGMLGDSDIVLALSYSGESAEILQLLPALKRLGAPLLAMVSNNTSTLARAADICLLTGVAQEACPHNLAPTASSTAALALGDALAMTILEARGFSPDDFARTHPLGQLGRRLLLRARDVMRQGDEVPRVSPDAPFSAVLLSMTGGRMGMTLVCDGDNLRGIITDGDLRRALDGAASDTLRARAASDLMTAAPQTIPPDTLAADAARLMKQKAINHLAVQDAAANSPLLGALSFHDLLRHSVV